MGNTNEKSSNKVMLMLKKYDKGLLTKQLIDGGHTQMEL